MKQSAALFWLFIILYMTLQSCDSIMQKNYEFYYYPSRNVYYNVDNKEYIYSLNGGQTWDSIFFSTDKESALLGAKQILYDKSPDIWVNNAEHIQQYKGQLINITVSDTTSSEQDLVAERKAKKVTAPVSTQNKEAEKKPGFFKRLFGKKKNNT